MAENTNNASVVARRGIATARGTQRLKFSHSDAKSNGLFIAHLESVDVSTIKIGEESTGLVSFTGMEIPRLRLFFASNEPNEAKRKYVTLSFTPAESNANTIPGGKEEWKITQTLDWLKHILNVFVLKGREFTEEEVNALSLDYVDFDETGQYVPVEPEVVISAWTKLFTAVANLLNGIDNNSPAYKSSNGQSLPLWIKLIRYNKTRKNGWSAIANGDLAFPTFVGEGCIELFKPNEMPAIKLNVTNECIIPKDIDTKKKEPNLHSQVGAGVPMGGVNIAGTDAPFNGNFGMVDDMPDFEM